MIGVRIVANAFQSEEIIELVEDLGDFPVNIRYTDSVIDVDAIVKREDIGVLSSVVGKRKFSGIIAPTPLFGTEIAVVIPSFSLHHTPFPHCSIVEVLREAGADVNTIALKRGVGRRTAMISKEERRMIEENDIAIFIFGCFEDCIKNYKLKLCEEISLPVVATGYADIEEEEMIIRDRKIKYVKGVGRIGTMFGKSEDKKAIFEINNTVIPIVNSLRPEIEDILPYVKMEIEYQIPESKPVKIKIGSLRVNLPFDVYAEKISKIKLYFGRLDEKVSLHKGFKGDIILTL